MTRTIGDPRDFYRVFMVPGMAHCSGGAGPNAFGSRNKFLAQVTVAEGPVRCCNKTFPGVSHTLETVIVVYGGCEL